MKINYTMYHVGVQTGINTTFEQGILEVPQNGHGIRCNLRRMFPGYDFSRMTVGREDYRMHNADWTCGIAIAIVR